MVYSKIALVMAVFACVCISAHAQLLPIRADSLNIKNKLSDVIGIDENSIYHFKRGNREIVVYGIKMPTGSIYYDTIVAICKSDCDVWYQHTLYTQVVDAFDCIEDGPDSIAVRVDGNVYIKIYWRSIPGYQEMNPTSQSKHSEEMNRAGQPKHGEDQRANE